MSESSFSFSPFVVWMMRGRLAAFAWSFARWMLGVWNMNESGFVDCIVRRQASS